MNFNNLNTSQKWLIGLLAAAVVLCGVFGLSAASFQMGRMSGGGRQGYVVQGPPAAPQAPQYQNDQPVPPQPPAAPQPGVRGNRGFGPMQHGPMGFGILGIIGGFFRLIFTIGFIMLIIFLVRRFVFGRGWGPRGWGWRGRGGPGGWNHGVPPHFEEWHSRMHGQPAPAPAASADAPAVPAADKPADAAPASDEGKLV